MLTDTSMLQNEYGDPTLEHIASVLRSRPGDRAAWDDAVEAADDALQTMGRAHWFVGDLACIVASENGYGTNAITNFARDINESESRVREWRTVSRFWNFGRRQQFLEFELLRYSHYKAAMALKDDADDFLYACVDNGWNVERARVEVKRIRGETITPPKLLTAHGRIIGIRPREGDDSSGHLVLDFLKGVNWYPLQDALNDKTLLTVTIKVASDATVNRIAKELTAAAD